MKHPYYGQFYTQRRHAKKRGIDFQFTFEEWIDWWGDDIVNRGRCKGQLCMARNGDTGPYHPDNVRKASVEQNHIEANKDKPKTAEHNLKNSQALKGRIFTDEHKKRISDACKGRIPWNKKVKVVN